MKKNLFLAVLLPLGLVLTSCGDKNTPDDLNKDQVTTDSVSVSYVKLADFVAYLPSQGSKEIYLESEDFVGIYLLPTALNVTDTVNNLSAALECEAFYYGSMNTFPVQIALSCTDGKTVNGSYVFEGASKKVEGTAKYVVSKEGDLPEVINFVDEAGSVVLQLTQGKGITVLVDANKRVFKL